MLLLYAVECRQYTHVCIEIYLTFMLCELTNWKIHEKHSSKPINRSKCEIRKSQQQMSANKKEKQQKYRREKENEKLFWYCVMCFHTYCLSIRFVYLHEHFDYVIIFILVYAIPIYTFYQPSTTYMYYVVCIYLNSAKKLMLTKLTIPIHFILFTCCCYIPYLNEFICTLYLIWNACTRQRYFLSNREHSLISIATLLMLNNNIHYNNWNCTWSMLYERYIFVV